jgi:polysaccharide biosynthesis/export protein
MTKFKFTVYCLASVLFLQSCSEILEPVALFNSKQDFTSRAGQEEFEINTKTLTFASAKKANKALYKRRLILTGSGSKANVLDESNFLNSSFPKSSNSSNYLIGIGDHISFQQLNEFETGITQWPSSFKVSEYLLGPGDELTFAQSNDRTQNISVIYGQDGQLVPREDSNLLSLTRGTTTQGTIGSNGNILLFGLGNILASNKTLEDVRTEVRNILIRDGLAPNFQLEISGFKSKKAFVIINNNISQTIYLNNLPISLQEVALKANLSKSNKSFAIVKLTRNLKEFRFTAEQLFDFAAPEIIIQDNDQIEIQVVKNKSTKIQTIVGLKGNILLPNVGSILAVNRTVNDVHKEISSIFIEKGIKPNFQLEITKFASKKAYLIQQNIANTVIPLTNNNTTLRQLLLGSNNSIAINNGLSVITLKRSGQIFQMTKDQVLDPRTPDILVADGDQIEIENLNYKPGQVFALSGAGNAQMISIDPSKRETLADILFAKNGALNNLLAKRSEVYLLRGNSPSIAYHLDAQNVSRILVAAKTELRPNDIVYIADRPIVSFSRTLSEILPLRILLRDIQNDNIP